MLRGLTDSILPDDIVLADADLIRVLLASIATLKLRCGPIESMLGPRNGVLKTCLY